MTYAEFTSLTSPSAELSAYLTALWHERQGDWNRAHEIVQDLETREAAAIHAYLHRREGNLSNAQYWYEQAHRKFDFTLSMDDEWERLVCEVLAFE
jgi:hypothetical protein